MSTPITSSTDFGIDSDVDSDDQSSPVEDLMIGMSQPSSALPQFSSKALDPENNRNWAESLPRSPRRARRGVNVASHSFSTPVYLVYVH